MSSDEIIRQLQQIVETLKRTIEASAHLAERVEALEQTWADKLGLLTSVQGHLEVLLETYQKHAEAQQHTNEVVEQTVSALESRIAALEARR